MYTNNKDFTYEPEGKVGMNADKKTAQQLEVDKNFQAFRAQLNEILTQHLGQFAVMKNGKIIEYFDSFNDAFKYASGTFSDGLFSVQEVSGEVADLGFLSHAVH